MSSFPFNFIMVAIFEYASEMTDFSGFKLPPDWCMTDLAYSDDVVLLNDYAAKLRCFSICMNVLRTIKVELVWAKVRTTLSVTFNKETICT